MEIRQIKGNLDEVIQLVTDVFMKYEAPDYSDEGIKAFFDTALNNQDYMNSLIIYGAFIDKKLTGVIEIGRASCRERV